MGRKVILIEIVGIICLLLFCSCERVKPNTTKTQPTVTPTITSTPTMTPSVTPSPTSTPTPIDTYQDKEPISVSNVDYQKYYTNLRTFATTENPIYSPISLNTALSVYSFFMKDGTAKDEVIEFTGGLPYMKYGTCKTENGIYRSFNRIWINEAKEGNEIFFFDEDRYIDLPNYKDYWAMYWLTDMSDKVKATAEKDNYVSEMTNGFITKTPTELTPDTMVDFMNVLYFKDIWEDGDLSLSTDTYEFTNKDGSISNVYMMKAYSTIYYENDTCYIIPMKYENGMTFYAIYPKDNLLKVDLTNFKENIIYNEATIELPEFESYVEISVSDYLDVLGLSMFSIADVIFTDQDYKADITQVVRIKVDHKGTEAAAVTEIDVKCTAVAPPENPLYLVFDKPFAYMIEDINGDIAFIGQVTNME